MKRHYKQWLLAMFFVTTAFLGQAQDAWTLEDCVNYAMENNIAIRQTSLNTELAENTLLQSRMNLYTPSINANVTHNFNFSNSVDPLTYEFLKENTQSTQFNLAGGYSLFEGLGRLNMIKANKEDLEASVLDVESAKNNTLLTIVNYYLQVMLAHEVLGVAKEEKVLTQNQLENTQALIDAGVSARGEVFEIEAQLANDELNIVNAEISLEKAFNLLKIALQLDPFTDMVLAEFDKEINIEAEMASAKSIAEQAAQILPNVKAARHRMTSAEFQLKTAKGSLSPTFSISGAVGTNYFSASRIPIGVDANGNIIFEKKRFGSQLSDNLGENVSIAMSIPIFGKWQRMTAVDNAKVYIQQTELEIENQKNNLNQDVFNAYVDLSAALKRYESTEKNVIAAAESFNYSEQKLAAGVVNNLEFETAKNRWAAAQADAIQAKYEYVFRKMILNYYKSGELTF